MARADRDAWVDNARGVLIILVVFGHVWHGLGAAGILPRDSFFETVTQVVHMFRMPAFFLLSAQFLEQTVAKRGLWGSFRRRILTVLYPLVVWSYIVGFFRLIGGDATNSGAPTLMEVLLYPFPPKDIFWFLGVLFAMQLAASFLVAKKSDLPLLVAIGAALLLSSGAFALERVDFLYRLVLYLPFFLAGLYLARHPAPATLAWAGLCSFALAVVAIAAQQGTAHPSVQYLAAFPSAIGLVLAFSLIRKPLPILSAAGRASLAIYVMHIMPMAACRILLMALGVDDAFVHVLAGTAGGVFLSYGAYLALRRFGLAGLFGLPA